MALSMRRCKFWIVLLTLTLGWRAGAQAPPAFDAAKLAQIKQQVSATMAEGKIPAISVAVISSKGQMSAGYGQADIANAQAAAATTQYRLASLSKPFTAVAVMQLAEAGKLDLDAPVQKYAPTFPVKQWPITTRQILGHISGIRHYEHEGFITHHHYANVTEALDIFKDAPLLFEPGTQYHYSSYGYNLLGCVIEGASGLKYEDYIQQNIFEPAHMTSSGFYDEQQPPANLAKGYGQSKDGRVIESEPGDTSYKNPSGGIYSTAEDIANFALALQNGKLVQPTTLTKMWAPQHLRDGKLTAYGLGWSLAKYKGAPEINHNGGQQGAITWLCMWPQQHVIVVVLCNGRSDQEPSTASLTHNLARALATIALR